MRKVMFRKAGLRLWAASLALLLLAVGTWNGSVAKAETEAVSQAAAQESVSAADADSKKNRNALIGERKVPGQKQESEAEETARQYEEFKERLNARKKRGYRAERFCHSERSGI